MEPPRRDLIDVTDFYPEEENVRRWPYVLFGIVMGCVSAFVMICAIAYTVGSLSW